MHAIKNGSRSLLRRKQAVPRHGAKVAEARLLHGRHVGQQWLAPEAGDRQGAQLAGPHVASEQPGRTEHRSHLAGQQILQRRRAAAIGHMMQFHAGAGLQHLDRKMRHRAEPARGDVDRRGLAARNVEELAQGQDVEALRIDCQNFLHAVDGRDGREVAREIETCVGIDQRRIGEAGITDQHGVAVRGGMSGNGCAHRATGAAAIVDHDGLVEPLARLRRERTGKRVGRAAGRERHDPGDGFLRPIAGTRSSGNERQQPAQCRASTECRHATGFGARMRCQSVSATMMPAIASPANAIAMVPPTRAKMLPKTPCPIASTAWPPGKLVVRR
jgi:hypothetical protein